MQLDAKTQARSEVKACRKKRHKKIAGSLLAASCSLLGTISGPALAEDTDRRWSFDTALSYYSEPDRVDDVSATVVAYRTFDSEGQLRLRLTVDSLTGASASGAVASTTPQTFTNPSGRNSYTTRPGELPLDPTFLDSRVAISADWSKPAGSRGEYSVGASFSNEYDYFHAGVNGRYSIDFNQRNSRLNFGLSFASDQIDPVGGAPTPLSEMLPVGDLSNRLADDDKTVSDFLVGWTQVFGKRTIGQLNYSFSQASGYLNDPYKIVSVLDPVTADPVAGPGGLFSYRFDGRPDERTKQSLFGQLKHQWGRQIIDGSYRFMTDDWQIDSHTIDLRWRSPIGRNWFLQPHLRYYTQSAAEFYRPYLLDGDPLPEFATADYRLGDFDAITYGLKIGRAMRGTQEWSMRIEYYDQESNLPEGTRFGSLQGVEIDPSVDAVIAQIGYRF